MNAPENIWVTIGELKPSEPSANEISAGIRINVGSLATAHITLGLAVAYTDPNDQEIAEAVVAEILGKAKSLDPEKDYVMLINSKAIGNGESFMNTENDGSIVE
jgi:hypothetical protein